MGWGAIAIAISGVVEQGLLLFNEERRTRFMAEHRDILDTLDTLKRRRFPYYSDVALIRKRKEFINFITAFGKELGYVAASLTRSPK